MFRWAFVASLTIAVAYAEPVNDWIQTNRDRVLQEFREFLRIPNIASDGPNIRRNVEAIQRMLEKRGVRTKLLEVAGAPPAVYGELSVPGASRTLGFYAHYDGQPVDPKQWRTGNPFEPVLEGDRLYGRSTSDDKAAIVAMAAAIDALKATGQQAASNVKFLFEGEEEAGSPHLGWIMKEHAGLLKSDVWLICDGPVHQSGSQQLYFGARGITTLELTVYGANRELHSGHYGGWAPNAAMRLAHLLASMHDESGRVLIAGFYERLLPLSELERRAIADTPPIDGALREELGLRASENSSRSLSDVVNEPSLNVRGLRSVDVGDQARNVIPASATASIDVRLVQGISPERAERLLIEHVRKQGYFVTQSEPDAAMRRQHGRIARIVVEQGYPAAKTPMDLPIARSIAAAVEKVRAPVVKAPTLGGSVPIYLFEQELKTPFIGLPIANHDNNQHSSNENIRLGNLWNGIKVMAAVMTMQ